MRYFFLLFIFSLFLNVYSGNLVIKDKEYFYTLPDSYFNEHIDKNKHFFSRFELKNLRLDIEKDKIVFKGTYKIFPFKVYLSVFRKSLDIYHIRVNKFLFFNMVQYSKRKLANIAVNSFSQNKDIYPYFKLSSNKNIITVKLKRPVWSIFPEKYKKKITKGKNK